MKFEILILSFLVSFILTIKDKSNYIKTSNSQDACDNKCGVCQKTVYDLKFNKLSNCNNSNNKCSNICHNIDYEWNKEESVFKPFKEEVFGKCDICFRAGYCSIAECKVQQEKEKEIIDDIVDKAKLTGKKEDIISKIGLNQFPGNVNYNRNEVSSIDTVVKDINKFTDNILKEVANKLDASLSMGSTSDVTSMLKHLINNNFIDKNTFSSYKISLNEDDNNNNNNIEISNSNSNNNKSNSDNSTQDNNNDINIKEALNEYQIASNKLINQSETLLNDSIATEDQKSKQIEIINKAVEDNKNLESLINRKNSNKNDNIEYSILSDVNKHMNNLLNTFKKTINYDKDNNVSKLPLSIKHKKNKKERKINNKKTRKSSNKKLKYNY